MHSTKTISTAQLATPSGSAAPWMALFALSAFPLFMLQLSLTATLQTVGLLSLAMVALAHLSVMSDKHFDSAHLAIKLIAPLQFAFVIWLSVYMGRELGGESFAASYAASIICLFGIVIVDALVSVALALIAGSCRSVPGLSLAALISAKYAGLLGGVK
jgi:hypothetical protein